MTSYYTYFGLDKLKSVFKVIKHNGGWAASFYKVFRTDDLKIGVVKGYDRYGNKYWENNQYFFSSNRWVEYAPHYALEYDGSQVPPEWFGWLHYKTDLVPDEEPFRPKYKWMLKHDENLSGTRWAFYPYSTTRPKIEPWDPSKTNNNNNNNKNNNKGDDKYEKCWNKQGK